MRLFSIMGAYALIANNELVHLAAGLILLRFPEDPCF